MTEFIITNETAGTLVFTSLDNFSLGSEDPPADMFAVANGNFAMSDMIGNEELQGLLDAGDITIIDENGGRINELVNLPGNTIKTIFTTSSFSNDIEDTDTVDWVNASVIIINCSSTIQVNGIQAGYPGEVKLLINNSQYYTLELQHNDSNADSENRLYNPENYSVFKIKKRGNIFIAYDGGNNKWRPILERKSG